MPNLRLSRISFAATGSQRPSPLLPRPPAQAPLNNRSEPSDFLPLGLVLQLHSLYLGPDSNFCNPHLGGTRV